MPGDLSVVGHTEFGEKFCKAVIGELSGMYAPTEWAKESKAEKYKEKTVDKILRNGFVGKSAETAQFTRVFPGGRCRD